MNTFKSTVGQSADNSPACGRWFFALMALVFCLAAIRIAGAESVESGVTVADCDSRLGAPLLKRERAVLGKESAAVVVIEVSSFKCDHCRLFHEKVFPRLRKNYIDSGRVQWVVINASNDPSDQTSQIFLIARGALRQGKYWELSDSLFQVGLRSPGELADFVAKSIVTDRGKLEQALGDPALRAEVAADFADYEALKIRGTPTFLVRKRESDGKWTEGVVEDLQPLSYFQQVLDERLKTR
jgi:protein-disulfide isomerase